MLLSEVPRMHVTMPSILLLRVLHAPLFCPCVFQRRRGTHQDQKLHGILILLFFTLNNDGLPADGGLMVRWAVLTYLSGVACLLMAFLSESLLSMRELHYASSALALPVTMCSH